LVLALFLFYALDPVVDRLQALRVPRVVASVVVVFAVVAATAGAALAMWPQIEAVVSDVPRGAQQLRARVLELRTNGGGVPALKKIEEAARAIDRAAVETTQPPVTPQGTTRVEVHEPWRVSDWLWSSGVGVLRWSGQAAMILFLTIFLLIEDDSFKRKLVRQMETLGSKRLTVQILNDIARQIVRYIWVQALTSAGVGVATAALLWWFDVEHAAVWGAFAGLLNIVPYIGPLIVTIVLAAVAFLQFGTIGHAAQVAGLTLVITSAESTFVTPHLLSRSAALNHVAIFMSILFWTWLWGAPGMLLAVPLLMAGKAICDHVPGLQGIGEFLGAEPSAEPAPQRQAEEGGSVSSAHQVQSAPR
jgi:predicted PurR-regulated permease PerM